MLFLLPLVPVLYWRIENNTPTRLKLFPSLVASFIIHDYKMINCFDVTFSSSYSRPTLVDRPSTDRSAAQLDVRNFPVEKKQYIYICIGASSSSSSALWKDDSIRIAIDYVCKKRRRRRRASIFKHAQTLSFFIFLYALLYIKLMRDSNSIFNRIENEKDSHGLLLFMMVLLELLASSHREEEKEEDESRPNRLKSLKKGCNTHPTGFGAFGKMNREEEQRRRKNRGCMGEEYI